MPMFILYSAKILPSRHKPTAQALVAVSIDSTSIFFHFPAKFFVARSVRFKNEPAPCALQLYLNMQIFFRQLVNKQFAPFYYRQPVAAAVFAKAGVISSPLSFMRYKSKWAKGRGPR